MKSERETLCAQDWALIELRADLDALIETGPGGPKILEALANQQGTTAEVARLAELEWTDCHARIEELVNLGWVEPWTDRWKLTNAGARLWLCFRPTGLLKLHPRPLTVHDPAADRVGEKVALVIEGLSRIGEAVRAEIDRIDHSVSTSPRTIFEIIGGTEQPGGPHTPIRHSERSLRILRWACCTALDALDMETPPA